jgi:hypothetical protein
MRRFKEQAFKTLSQKETTSISILFDWSRIETIRRQGIDVRPAAQ